MKVKYCKHCNRLITDDNFRSGYGFIYHQRCYEKIYGVFED